MLEFNCRFGDPETQAILPRIEGDLLGALLAAAQGDLSEIELAVSDRAAVTVAVAAENYPESGDSGTPIEGVEAAEAGGAVVFHAGTAVRDGGWSRTAVASSTSPRLRTRSTKHAPAHTRLAT